jgi:UDP-N-acetylmuramate: L-alanyl-gamma-D-glutamyl-meso-diaminopimelate ligase
VRACVAGAFCPVEYYGFHDDAHWRTSEMAHAHGVTHWKVAREGRPWAEFALPVAGEHNAMNATAAAALAAGQGIPLDAITEALRTFESVKRRLEVRAVINGITIIDDFAHHPTAIRETLRALRAAYPRSRLWAVLEPRSNTLRRSVFQKELVESLAEADRVVLAGVFKQESIPEHERLHPEQVILDLAKAGREAALYAHADDIVDAIAPELIEGDVVAILSNGGFDGIYEKLPARLAALCSR